MATLKEIAKKCSITTATVSRVLNHKNDHGFSVSKELREKIFNLANELDYRPNLMARSLGSEHTMLVGIIGLRCFFDDTATIYQSSLQEIGRSLYQKGYNVSFTLPSPEGDSEFPTWRVDGIIILERCSGKSLKKLEQNGLPYVTVNGPCGDYGSGVVPDDVSGTVTAIRHLYDLGHRRISYCGPDLHHPYHESIDARHSTYLSELGRLGLSPIPGHEKKFESAAGYLMNNVVKNNATAILSYGSVQSLKILAASHEMGIKIPQQVSMICFNDVYPCEFTSPPLTTVAVPSGQMGRVGAELLLKIMESTKEVKRETVKLPERLIVRGSTATAPD